MDDVVRGSWQEGEESLGPAVEVHVMVKVAVDRLYCTHQSRDDLQEDEHDEEIVAEMAIRHDAAVGEPPQRQQTDAHERDESRATAHDDGQLPFLLVGDQPVVGPLRREQAKDMAEEHQNDTHMEEVAAPLEQWVIAQKLGGIGLHGIALRRDAVGDAADEERAGDIGEVLE